MQARISYIRDHLRTSFWFVPALMTVSAIFGSVFTLFLDGLLDEEDLSTLPVLHALLYSGGPDGARQVLSAIAGSMITVAGTVFSITIVALTLASNQFGPRLLNNFVRDRGNQVTLGTFIAAFLYSLLVLRTIRSGEAADVPYVSVTVALLFAVGGLVVLIYFIHHISTAIQAPNLVAVISAELQSGVVAMFPDVETLQTADAGSSVVLPAQDPFECSADQSGYVQVIDVDGLVSTARAHDLLIRLTVRPGRFVVPSSVCAEVWPASGVTEEVAARIAGSIACGARRTPLHDVEFSVRQLAEVAVRSLSPGINDPVTAETCVDQLSVGLCALVVRRFPAASLVDSQGSTRLVIGDEVTFEQLVSAAFDQVRQCASFHAAVYGTLLVALSRIARLTRDPSRLDPLLRSGDQVLEAARRSVPAAVDRERVQTCYDGLLAAAGIERTGLSEIRDSSRP